MAEKTAYIVAHKMSEDDLPRDKKNTPWFVGFKTEGGQPHKGRRFFKTRERANKEVRNLKAKFEKAGYKVIAK